MWLKRSRVSFIPISIDLPELIHHNRESLYFICLIDMLGANKFYVIIYVWRFCLSKIDQQMRRICIARVVFFQREVLKKKCALFCQHTEHFHISHFTYHLRCYIIIDHSWKLLTMFYSSYIKLCYAYVEFKRTNQSCSPSKISQSIKVEWRNCDKNEKQFFQWKKARNVLIEKKIEKWTVKNIFLLDFARY